MTWKSQLDIHRPYWDGYREILGRLPETCFPDTAQLNQLLPPGTANHQGQPIEFVDSDSVPDQAYERHIYETGEVSTRKNNWHDLFNALVWCRLPRTKAAMNALHYENLHLERDGRRGELRDALTLLDESGAILLSSEDGLLAALAGKDWKSTFVDQHDSWFQRTRLIVCGHALLEKFLDPYKAITAQVLLLRPGDLELQHEGVPEHDLDDALSRALLSGRHLTSTASLSPLPLMGIPGWSEGQDAEFYNDKFVFRPPRTEPGNSGP